MKKILLLGIATATVILLGVLNSWASIDQVGSTDSSSRFRWDDHLNSKVDGKIRARILARPSDHSYSEDYARIVEMGIKAVPSLVNIAGDESIDVKKRWVSLIAAAEIVGKADLSGEQAKLKDAFCQLLERFLKHPFSMVRTAAIKSIVKMNDSVWLPKIHEALRDRTVIVRDEVVRALTIIKDNRSIPELKKAFYDRQNFIRGKSLFIRKRILQSLAVIGSKEATPFLIGVLKDRDAEMSEESVRLLALINTDKKFTTSLAWLSWWEKKTVKKKF